MRARSIHSLMVVVSLVAASGCGGGRKAGWESGAAPTQAAAPADEAGAAKLAELTPKMEDAWANRGDVARLQEAIALMEEMGKLAPQAETYTRLSRAYYFLAESAYSLDESKKAVMLETYDKGVKAGEVAVALSSPDFVKAVKGGSKWEDAVKTTAPESVPALYWYGANLGKWARAQGFTTVLSNRDRIKSTMTQCLTLDPDYFHAAPHRYFGAYYAVAPGFAGGDLGKSEAHFKESMSRAPNYLATKVLMADTLMTKKDDKATFKKLLEEVLAADPNSLPDLLPEQQLEQKKATQMLKNIDEIF